MRSMARWCTGPGLSGCQQLLWSPLGTGTFLPLLLSRIRRMPTRHIFILHFLYHHSAAFPILTSIKVGCFAKTLCILSHVMFAKCILWHQDAMAQIAAILLQQGPGSSSQPGLLNVEVCLHVFMFVMMTDRFNLIVFSTNGNACCARLWSRLLKQQLLLLPRRKKWSRHWLLILKAYHWQKEL